MIVLLATAAVLIAYRDAYWRPFDDSPQDSTVSFHAYGFAAANGASLGPNPFVARDIDVRESRIRPYPHWPNGFFLLFEGVLRIFGRTELVGRSFAIAGSLLGFTLVIVSLRKHDLLLYSTLPLILLSGSGRDSVPFVFIDVAQYVWLGVLLGITAWLPENPRYNLIFRSAMLAALFFNQLVLPLAAVIIILKWVERRRTRDLVIDFILLGAGGVLVLLAMAAGAGSLSAGTGELLRIFRYRSSESLTEWAGALGGELRESLNLGLAGAWLVAAAWLLCLRAKQWRTVALLPSYLLFALVLREYVTMHHFARLLFAFFSLVTLVSGVEVALAWSARGRDWGRMLTAARVAIALVAAVVLGSAKQQYQPNRGMQIARTALMRIVNDPRQSNVIARCNAFTFQPDYREEHFDPFDRMGQFFFGMQVVERVRRGEPVRKCLIDFESYTVRGPL